MSEKAGEPAPLDVKATHVTHDWKHSAPLIGCRFDPSGRFVFTSAMDQNVQRWNVKDGKAATLSAHDSWLRGIGFSTDGQKTYTAGYDGKLCFWETQAESPTPTHEIDAHHGWIRWLAVHPAGRIVATAGNDLQIKLWDANSGELVRQLDGHQKHIYSLMFHPKGKLLLSGDLAGQINVWDLDSGAKVRTLEATALHIYHRGQQVDYGGVRCMALSPDGQQLACGGLHKGTNPFAGVQEPLVVILDWESGKVLRTHEATQIDRGIIWRLCYLADGTLMGASGGGTGGFLLFWNESDKNEIHKFKLPNTVLDMDYYGSSMHVATAHHDGHLRLSRLGK